MKIVNKIIKLRIYYHCRQNGMFWRCWSEGTPKIELGTIRSAVECSTTELWPHKYWWLSNNSIDLKRTKVSTIWKAIVSLSIKYAKTFFFTNGNSRWLTQFFLTNNKSIVKTWVFNSVYYSQIKSFNLA